MMDYKKLNDAVNAAMKKISLELAEWEASLPLASGAHVVYVPDKATPEQLAAIANAQPGEIVPVIAEQFAGMNITAAAGTAENVIYTNPASLLLLAFCPLCQKPAPIGCEPDPKAPNEIGGQWHWRGERCHRVCFERRMANGPPEMPPEPPAPVVAEPARCARCGAEFGHVKRAVECFSFYVGPPICIDCVGHREPPVLNAEYQALAKGIRAYDRARIPHPFESWGWYNRTGV